VQCGASSHAVRSTGTFGVAADDGTPAKAHRLVPLPGAGARPYGNGTKSLRSPQTMGGDVTISLELAATALSPPCRSAA
jgi:hypothetical protein